MDVSIQESATGCSEYEQGKLGKSGIYLSR